MIFGDLEWFRIIEYSVNISLMKEQFDLFSITIFHGKDSWNLQCLCLAYSDYWWSHCRNIDSVHKKISKIYIDKYYIDVT